MFKTRLDILFVLLALAFLGILARLWQLQITRHEKYEALAQRDKGAEAVSPALRGQIVDRFGQVLAEDRPFFDLSVRVDRLRLERVSLAEVKAVRALHPEGREREAHFDRLLLDLREEPFVQNLAAACGRSVDEVADGLLKALDAVARQWAAPSAPQRLVGAVDEKIWLGLRALHEDVFLDSRLRLGAQAEKLPDAQSPPFPGLVCTLSTRRVYPQGRLACFVLGTLGELAPEDEEFLRRDGLLLDNAAARDKAWTRLREGLDPAAAARLEDVLRVDPRDLDSLGSVYERLASLRPSELKQAAQWGLAEPVRWTERPPRLRLVESEMLWLGVGLSAGHHRSLPDRVIGESGVERFQNDLLRGKSGVKPPEDADADDDARVPDSAAPREGETVALTLSSTWQRAVERALSAQAYHGAVVVLDVRNGEVLALASYPSFDPNLFVPPRTGEERQAQLKALLNSPDKPLLNRAVSEQYPLGSVMKTIVAAAALQAGKVTPTETFECPGCIKLGNLVFHCDSGHAHGTVDLRRALRVSCNVTFHQIGARLGVEGLAPYAKLIFGRRTGIDLPAEAAGIYPDREWREKNAPGMRWSLADDYLLAIGQGQMTCTVLQATVLMAAVANGGYVVTPRLWLDGPTPAAIPLGISAENLAIVRQGLTEVVNEGHPGSRGTAYAPFHEQGAELAVRVAGKTSTAEHGRKDRPHAWFAGYAPADCPQVAFAVMLEDAGHGGSVAAPVAYKFLKEVYGTKDSPERHPGGPRDADLLVARE